MPTLTYIDGFELQAVFGSGAGFGGTGGENPYTTQTNASISTTFHKHGDASLQVAPTIAAAGRVTRTIPAGHGVLVQSFYVMLASLPASGVLILGEVTGSGSTLQLVYSATTGKFGIRKGSAAITDVAEEQEPIVVAGEWYLIDWKTDTSTSTYSQTARVNGGADAIATHGGSTAHDTILAQLGTSSQAGPASTMYYDDWLISYTTGDYPIGGHQVDLILPTSDGTHNGGTNIIEDQTGADIGGGYSTAYQLVDDIPPDNTTYIKQSQNASSGYYAEVAFGSPARDVWGATYWCALVGSGAGTSDLIMRVVDSGGTTLVDQGGVGAVNGTTVRYSAKTLAADPTGNKGRIGFGDDSTPVPRALAFVVQTAWEEHDFTSTHITADMSFAPGSHTALFHPGDEPWYRTLDHSVKNITVLPGLHTATFFTGPVVGTVYGVPASIASDGSADVTVALENFIASVPDGASLTSPSIISFKPGGNYRIEDIIWVTSRNNLYFEGHGARLYATTIGTPRIGAVSQRSQMTFDSCDGITVQNLKVEGVNANPGTYNPTYFGQHGLRFRGTDHIIVKNCTSTNPYGDGFYFGPNGTTGCGSVKVQGCTITGTGRQGIGTTHAADFLAEGNSLSLIGRSGFDFEPANSTQSIRNVTVRYNTLDTLTHGSYSFSPGGAVISAYVGYNLHIGRPTGINAQMTAVRPGGTLVFEYNYGPDVVTSSTNDCIINSFTSAIVRNNVVKIRSSPASNFVACAGNTQIQVTDNYCLNANPVVQDNGGNGSIVQSNNTTVGDPPDPDPKAGVAGYLYDFVQHSQVANITFTPGVHTATKSTSDLSLASTVKNITLGAGTHIKTPTHRYRLWHSIANVVFGAGTHTSTHTFPVGMGMKVNPWPTLSNGRPVGQRLPSHNVHPHP